MGRFAAAKGILLWTCGIVFFVVWVVTWDVLGRVSFTRLPARLADLLDEVCGLAAVEGRVSAVVGRFSGGRESAELPGREELLPRLPGILNGNSRLGGISSSRVSKIASDDFDIPLDEGGSGLLE
jgi:hypothetical protein